jgi:PIN domain nuclease of toxin-antitoxin system
LKLLLDTHALLALLSGDYPLSANAQDAMAQPDAQILASAVNVWEIAIKRKIGKLETPDNVIERIDEAGTSILAITARHAQAGGSLPLHHRDPFDRLLIAQAKHEGCAILTKDPAFAAYGVPVVW